MKYEIKNTIDPSSYENTVVIKLRSSTFASEHRNLRLPRTQKLTFFFSFKDHIPFSRYTKVLSIIPFTSPPLPPMPTII